MKFLFLFLFSITSLETLLSQSIDSVDKAHVKKCYALTLNASKHREWNKALAYADTVCLISEKGNYLIGIAVGLISKGDIYMKKGAFKNAHQFYNRALGIVNSDEYEGNMRGNLYEKLFKLFSIQNNQDSVKKYKDIILNLPCEKFSILAKEYVARQLWNSNQLGEALLVVRYNVICAKEIGNRRMEVKSLRLMSSIYRRLEDYEKAIFYADSSLKMSEIYKDSAYIVMAYDNLGIINSKLKNYSKALKWFRKGVKIVEKINNKSGYYNRKNLTQLIALKGALYDHLASTYQDLDNQRNTDYYADSVNFYQQKGLQYNYQRKDTLEIASSLINIAKFIISKKDNYNAALDSLQKAYDISPRHIGWEPTQYYIYSTQGQIYTELKQYDKAELYLDKAELVAQNLTDTISRLMAIYELQGALYLAKGDYKKAYDYEVKTISIYKEQAEQKKQKALIRFETKYETEQVQQQNILLAKERDIQELKATQNQLKAEKQQQWIYAGAVLLFFIIIISILLIIQFRNKAFFLTQKLQYQLLRNQMNPHFIFNALTAIQSFVYKKKPVEAGEYIASFAELMRAILDNSQEEYVSLNKEIQWLENYLKLQLLRFGNQFDYTLRLDPEIDLEDTMIPPMLTQPFIENALEHGLKDIDYKGHLDININVQDNLLEVDILDNGIGLEASKKNNENKTYESKATKITQERLNFLNAKQVQKINLRIQSNEGKGTKVSFTIPFISQY